jgi:hypothetical protein
LFSNAAQAAPVYTLPLQAPTDGSTAQDEGGSVTIGQVTYNSTSLTLFSDSGYGTGNYYLGGSGSDLTLSISGGGHDIIDLELGVYLGTDSVEITVNGASADTLTISGFPNYTFIGITDSCPITSLTFHDINNPDTEIDIISPESGVIGLPTPAPEPATLALTLLGGAGLLLIRRRK